MSPAVFVLQQFVLSLEGVIHGFYYQKMLKLKNPDQPAWVLMLGCWISYLLVMSISWITGQRIAGYINLICIMPLFQILLKIFCTDRLQTRLFANALLYLMQALADVITTSIFLIILKKPGINYMQDNMLVLLVVGLGIEFGLDALACRMWNQKKNIRRNGFAIVSAALVVVFFYLLFLSAGFLTTPETFSLSMLAASFISLAGTATAVLVCFFYQQKQQKNSQLEWENLHRIRQRQEDFFRELEEQERKTSFVRHDHLNVLSAALQLLYQQEEDAVETLLVEYEKRIREDCGTAEPGLERDNI